MKILILGTGNAQADAIHYLKKKGHTVYTTSYEDDKNGRHTADYFQIIDIRDKEKTAAFVAENAIDRIYSVGSDIAMPTIGYVSETLGLPYFVTEETARLMQNKKAFRNFLESNGFCNIRFLTSSSADRLNKWRSFPAVVKPVDSQGQRGIFKVSNSDELNSSFQKSLLFSRSGTVIVEEYIPGIEVSVNSYVYNGQFLYHFISQRDIIEDAPGGIVKSHSIPVSLPEPIKRKIIDQISSIIKKLNILNGPVYFQIKIPPGGDPVIIEGTPRLDGCHMWRLIMTACGINLLDLTFEHLLNRSLSIIQKQPEPIRTFQLQFIHQKPGSIFNIQAFKDLLPAHHLEFYYKNGDTVKPVNGYYEKVGYYILQND